MRYCPNCGAPADGRFCAKCGASLEGASASPDLPPPPPQTAGGLSVNMASALCYVLGLLTGIIFLVLEPYNRNRTVRFHAFQSIFAHVGIIVIWFVAGMVLRGFLVFLWPLVSLGSLALWLFLIFSAYQGKKVVLPLVGPLAEQQT